MLSSMFIFELNILYSLFFPSLSYAELGNIHNSSINSSINLSTKIKVINFRGDQSRFMFYIKEGCLQSGVDPQLWWSKGGLENLVKM